ncbi:MAG: hypothetical protein H8E44_18600 [Planctomycetes bacterium]|nr:hypothetical protein [Planctomycetota bacterium]MBL7039798.1 hypothetical protein [Pirellulaceae bacterium]
MFDDNPYAYHPSEQLADEDSSKWTPQERLGGRLLVGAGAALVTICLTAIGMYFELTQVNEPDGVTPTDMVDTVAILPEIVVLLAFLGLARETNSIGLWRSSIVFFAIGWIVSAGFVLAELTLPDQWQVLALTAGVSIVCLIVLVARRPRWYRPAPLPPKPDVSDRPSSASKKKGTGGIGCMTIFGIYMLIKIGVRLIRNAARIDLAALLAWGLILAIGLLYAVPAVCFGISKIRLRDKLGVTAVLSGILDFIGAALAAAVFVWLGVLLSQQGETDEMWDPVVTIAFGFHSIIYDLVVVALFLSVRNLISPSWNSDDLAPT